MSLDEPLHTAPGGAFGTGWDSKLGQAFRALRYRNYRLFFYGQGISLVGSWMHFVALSWLVHRLTGSAEMLGKVVFVNRLPTAVMAPFAGVLVDQFDRRKLVILCQALEMIQAFLLAILTLTGQIQLWHVFAMSAGLGISSAVEMAARQALVVDLIECRDDLGNAIALNSSLFNGARLIGPAIAGALIAIWGEGICFLINGLSYVAVLWGLIVIHVPPREYEVSKEGVFRTLWDGFHYALGFRPILVILLFGLMLGLFGMPYTVIMPTYVDDVLRSDSHGYGLILSAAGVGAFGGAIYLAQRASVRGLGPVIVTAVLSFSLGALLCATTSELHVALLMMPLIGGGLTVAMASMNTILQSVCDDDKRGRVMSLWILFSVGSFPIGSILAGGVAEIWGVPLTLRCGAILSILAALMFATQIRTMRKMVRPIYIAKGIITDVRSLPLLAAQARVELRS